jgi:acyl-CoA synthetase (AMP-forming)/AMP-acid ligase II
VGGTNLADLLEQVASAVPEQEAVLTGATRHTYAALVERVHRFANLFLELGLGAGDHIGLALHNNADHLEALFGAFTIRAVPVNINWRYTTAELRSLFADAGLSAVVHEAELTGSVAAAATLSAARCLPRGPALDAQLAAASAARPHAERSGDDRYLIYTGGTTGAPKGVEWRHEDLLAGALGGADGPDGSRARVLQTSPLTHGTAQWSSLMTLLSGGTVVLTPSGAFDPTAVWTLAQRERVTHLVIVGDAFARPLVEALDAQPHRWDLADLLLIVSGGAALSPPLREALLAHLPGAAVVDGYGTSEMGGGGRMTVFPGQRGAGLLRFAPNDDIAVFDDDRLLVAPGSGKVGRLARRGHLPLGYRNDPERTARTFPTIGGERWSMPGDLATIDLDGNVVLLGRSERVINTGGEKVFAEEVEAVLSSHPSVRDTVVVGVPDERWGERVAAIVALEPDRPSDIASLIGHCRHHLAGFKTPRLIELVDRVPRLASGKPDHRWARMVVGRSVQRRTV